MSQNAPRPFIITTSLAKPDRAAMRDARSYAMRGKNSGKRRKRIYKDQPIRSWVDDQLANEESQDMQLVSPVPNQVNRQIASEWTILNVAEDIGPHPRQMLDQYFSILEETSYANKILARNVFNRQAPLWMEHLGQSATYLNNQLFVLIAYYDLIIARTLAIRQSTISHMTRALSLLQTDLRTSTRAISEATISTIIAFAMVAFMSGDTASAEKHLQGLVKVVALRGGLRSLRSCRYLQTKCCRLDLSFAMCTSSTPLFFTAGNISWTSYLPRTIPVQSTTAIHRLLSDSGIAPDTNMLAVYSDLQEFSRAANLAAQTGRKLEPDLLQDVMISIQYRLLHLKYENSDPHELLRVIMLDYSATVLLLLFCQFGAYVWLNFPSLQVCLRIHVQTGSSNERSRVWLWLLVVVGLSQLDCDMKDLESYLACTVRDLGLKSWKDVLVVLKSFLWIDVLHSERGKALLTDIVN
ncbi:hypothetical protein ONS95_001811 [Cadophora gregata]|uniref:uncharacterized protein n=2 Tax=Cadophora gregata TaxID=51156 RepID=UPI0026DC3B2F|nr:uncharacterized protein ONS95_001811 [Cadophora gregata]KAK0111454.1 hypothetical protein ONS95_001811 [Cadophora gregata]